MVLQKYVLLITGIGSNPTVGRECNFAMGTNFGQGFCASTGAYIKALVPLALVLAQNPFPKLSPWRN